MKKVMYVLTFTLLKMLYPNAAHAQTATATATAYTSKTDGNVTASHSVSVQNSDSSYNMKAEFDPAKTAEIKKLLDTNLDKQYRLSSSGKWHWKKEENNETAYSFLLSEGRLKINIAKDLLSASTYKNLESISERAAAIISSK